MPDREYIEAYFNVCGTCITRELEDESVMVRAILGACVLIHECPEGVPADTSLQQVREEYELQQLADDETEAAIDCATARLNGVCPAGQKIWKSIKHTQKQN